MKKKFIIVSLLLVSFLLPGLLHAATTPLDGIAAVVNDDTITISQLQDRVAAVKQELTVQKITVPPNDVLTNQVLQMMIDESLEKQTAARLNIIATTEDVQHAIAEIARQQNLTSTQLREAIQQQGIGEESFIQQIKQQIILQKLLHDAVAGQITVTPAEIDTGVQMALSDGQNNEYHLLHILVPLPDSPSPEQINTAKIKANNILHELQQGADFKSVAVAQSGDLQMFNGGDMGWKSLNELPTIFAQTVLKMQQGSLVGPIQTANGFHILKLIGVRNSATKINKDQLRQQVSQMIFQRKLAEKQQDWLGQLRATSYIKIYYQPASLPTPKLK